MAILFSSSKRGGEPNAQVKWAGDELIAVLLGYERRARTIRLEIFDTNVLNDSSWPILQELFAAHLERRDVRISDLSEISGLPETTVARYLDHLEKFDVIRRETDRGDSVAVLVTISEAGAFWMREYFTRLIASEQGLHEDSAGVFELLRRQRDAP